jgi:hypothetical protein
MSATVNLIARIIQEQELIIGPLAWREARKVPGLRVSEKQEVAVEGSARDVLSGLVRQYEGLFGPASRQVCRDAVKSLLSGVPAQDVPDVLK